MAEYELKICVGEMKINVKCQESDENRQQLREYESRNIKETNRAGK